MRNPKLARVYVQMDPELFDVLRALAEYRYSTLSSLVREVRTEFSHLESTQQELDRAAVQKAENERYLERLQPRRQARRSGASLD